MSGVARFPAAIATKLLVVLVAACSGQVVSSSFATATATATIKSAPVQHHHLHHRVSGPVTPTAQAIFHFTPPVADGKVDVYLDLACPDSAAAWPTVRQIVWEYGFRTEFVLHILPTSQSDVAFDAAKAAQVVRMFSADSEEAFLFIDAVLDHQLAILNEGNDDDMTQLEFFDTLVSEAVAGGCVTEDQFHSGMEDPRVDHLVRNELEAAASLSVYATPTVRLNGMFMMHLVDAETLRNFELFVGRGMSPKPIELGADGDTWRALA